MGTGSIDLCVRDQHCHLMLVGFKRHKATHEAVHQLARYTALGLEFKQFTALPGLKLHNPQTALF